ncbi:MAG: 4Fe-4S ferredoxin [Candidatus Bathyarchaeota archaeon]|nr:4Fe-4S ferredoxin [Candidatus Termiticorpusculum sp.]MCL2868872.1 4Fe-4S ferredoxin [Candidatus Termiticorpusculum sp.]
MKRKIVHIDESLCNGCGQCIPGCVEQALQIVEGKARIVKDIYCDGLGACLGHCPQGAITIIEREAEAFDKEEVHKYINNQTLNTQTDRLASLASSSAVVTLQKVQWPIKIDLISPKAPFFENANVLFVADCAPVVFKDFQNIARGKQVIIGCPKFNDAKAYAAKMSEILKLNNINSITVVHMEVPCCTGLKWVVNKALEDSGKKVLTQEIEVKVGGETIELKW